MISPARVNSYLMALVLFLFILAIFNGTKYLAIELHCSHFAASIGKNFVLGLCVALMALTFDMTLVSWAEAKKKVLGLD
jgi:glycine betaine/proline transport system permease protein